MWPGILNPWQNAPSWWGNWSRQNHVVSPYLTRSATFLVTRLPVCFFSMLCIVFVCWKICCFTYIFKQIVVTLLHWLLFKWKAYNNQSRSTFWPEDWTWVHCKQLICFSGLLQSGSPASSARKHSVVQNINACWMLAVYATKLAKCRSKKEFLLVNFLHVILRGRQIWSVYELNANNCFQAHLLTDYLWKILQALLDWVLGHVPPKWNSSKFSSNGSNTS